MKDGDLINLLCQPSLIDNGCMEHWERFLRKLYEKKIHDKKLTHIGSLPRTGPS